MVIAVRYFTRTGNTKKLAEAIGRAIGVSAKNVSAPLEVKTDVLFLCSSVYAAGVDEAVKAFVKQNAPRIGLIVNVSTAALLPSTWKQVKKLADECGIAMAEEEFHCRGSFAVLHRGHPNADDMRNAAAFAQAVVKKKIQEG